MRLNQLLGALQQEHIDDTQVMLMTVPFKFSTHSLPTFSLRQLQGILDNASGNLRGKKLGGGQEEMRSI